VRTHLGPKPCSQLTDARVVQQTGINGLRPHMFRHLFASSWLADGGTEGSLMRLAGWRSRAMLDRYGAAVASARAHAEHQRLAPDDKW